MLYATAIDLRRRYGQQNIDFLANDLRDKDEGGDYLQSVDDVVNIALEDASAQIDGYISGRVSLPVDNVPSVLVRTACVLARYNLENNVATEKTEKDKDDAIRFLEKVAKGDISLGLSTDDKQIQGAGDCAIISSAGSVWARDKSRGYI